MKFLYAVKGCSHCDLRMSCDLKNHKANLAETSRVMFDTKNPLQRWWSQCKDFFREVRSPARSAKK